MFIVHCSMSFNVLKFIRDFFNSKIYFFFRQMKMRPGEVLVDRLESIEDTKVCSIRSHLSVLDISAYSGKLWRQRPSSCDKLEGHLAFCLHAKGLALWVCQLIHCFLSVFPIFPEKKNGFYPKRAPILWIFLEDYPWLARRPVFFSVRGAVKWNCATHLQKMSRQGVFPSCWLQQCPQHHDKNRQLQTARTHWGSLPPHQVQPHKVQLMSVI